MIESNGIVDSLEEIQKNIFILRIRAEGISKIAKPGQFCNIKVNDSTVPLLRRPFSICEVEDDRISFQINVVGEGTKILTNKKTGDVINLIGPLGNGFNIEGEFENAIIVAGGVGAAPFPFLIKSFDQNVSIASYVGGRTEEDLITYNLKNIHVSTDDGSKGFHGNVVSFLESEIDKYDINNTVIFACGPNPMLRALSRLSIDRGIRCQVSTESAMACGIGICQGCNIEGTHSDRFLLVCKDGPVFNAEDVRL